MQYDSSQKPKLIYVFQINDSEHIGCLKIGMETCNDNGVLGLQANDKALDDIARKRIDQYAKTAGIKYELLHTEVALSSNGLKPFSDKEVFAMLEKFGVKRKTVGSAHSASEWFITDLDTVKSAISALKDGKNCLTTRMRETK